MFLIIDDDASAGLARLLHREGFYATSFRGSEVDLAAIKERRPRPRVLVLNTQTPGPEGLALLGALHNDPELSAIPIAVYSADPAPQTADMARQLGAADYMVKGTLTIPQLVEHLTRLRTSAAPSGYFG